MFTFFNLKEIYQKITYNFFDFHIILRYLLKAAHCIGKGIGIPQVARLGVVNMDDTEGVSFQDVQLKVLDEIYMDYELF